MKWSPLVYSTAVSIILLTSGCSTMKETRQFRADTVKTLGSIQESLSRLAEEKKARNGADEKVKVLRAMAPDGSRIRDEDLLPLAELTVPADDASNETVKDYIAAILATAGSSGSFSQNDVQVKLLNRLGRARLPLMLEMMTAEQYGSRASYYLRYAVENLADNSSQNLVLEALKSTSYDKGSALLSLVSKMKWEKAAQPMLMRMLEERLASSSSYVDTSILDMLVRVHDPETYPMLTRAVAKSSNFSYTAGKLKSLEDFDFEKLLDEAWDNRAAKSGSDLLFIAQYAAQKGNPIALDLLVSGLTTTSDPSGSRMQFDPRFALLAVIDFRGTDAEIAAWYKENQSRLKYDKERQKFVVSADE